MSILTYTLLSVFLKEYKLEDIQYHHYYYFFIFLSFKNHQLLKLNRRQGKTNTQDENAINKEDR